MNSIKKMPIDEALSQSSVGFGHNSKSIIKKSTGPARYLDSDGVKECIPQFN